jgi:hypothetical protein
MVPNQAGELVYNVLQPEAVAMMIRSPYVPGCTTLTMLLRFTLSNNVKACNPRNNLLNKPEGCQQSTVHV